MRAQKRPLCRASIVEKAKENVEAAVEKVTSTLSQMTSSDKAEEDVKTTSSDLPKDQTKADVPRTEQTETPQTPAESRPKSSEVRPGASWANIARGPANSAIESN